MAIWSEIRKQQKGFRHLQQALLEEARFTSPAPAKSKKGGQYPHLQPFFRNVKKES